MMMRDAQNYADGTHDEKWQENADGNGLMMD